MKRRTIAWLATATLIGAACSLRDLTSLDSAYDGSSSADASTDTSSDVSPPLTACSDASGLVAEWLMNEGTDIVVHDCAGSHDGTMADSGVSWTADPEAGAVLSFDGFDSGKGVVRPNVDFTVSPPFTVAMWVLPNQNQHLVTGELVVQQNSINTLPSWQLGILSLNTGQMASLTFVVGLPNNKTTTLTSSKELFSTWAHVAVTFDGVNVAFYHDGQLSTATAIDAGYVDTPGAKIRIGNSAVENFPYTGSMRDLRIYGRILSAADIQALAN
jgi:hypothetical protein